MSKSELYQLMAIGIPICLVFAIGALATFTVQAKQLSKLDNAGVAKRAAIGGLSLGVSVSLAVVLGFAVGLYVAAILMVLWFLTVAALPSFGQSELAIFAGLLIAAIPVLIILLIIGSVLGIWPLSLLSIRGYKIAKQKPNVSGKMATAAIVFIGAACSITSILAAAGVMTAIAIELSGKRFGLT